MKGKKSNKAKSRSKPKHRSKPKARVRTKTTASAAGPVSIPSSSMPVTAVTFKTCQEVEVGDIGGFGSPEELEEHEKRCSETAIEFCSHCGKNLCRNHYDLMHRDHDSAGRTTSPSPA